MESTGTIKKARSSEVTPVNWDEFLEIIFADVTEEEIDKKTSHLANKEELWQFLLNAL